MSSTLQTYRIALKSSNWQKTVKIIYYVISSKNVINVITHVKTNRIPHDKMTILDPIILHGTEWH